MAIDDDYPLGLPPDPIALLPVRIETRYVHDGSRWALRVRIYPDEIHLDNHRVEPSELELAWRAEYLARPDRAAWSVLVRRVGAARAAYLASPALGDAGGSVPAARLLPERFAVVAYPRGAAAPIVRVTSSTIPDATDRCGRRLPIAIERPADWIYAFDEARARGMALELTEADGPITDLARLIVIGANLTGDGTRGLAELFAAHRFTDGIGVLGVGVPTNNTGAVASAVSSRDPDEQRSYDREIADHQVPRDCAATRLARTLGPCAAAFERGDQALVDLEPDAVRARAMKTLMWPATLGYFLTGMVNGAVGAVEGQDLHGLCRRHFIEQVDNRGPVPTIRIGHQPYGIVPVTALDAIASTGDRATLRDLLIAARQAWLRCVNEVPRVLPPDEAAERPEHAGALARPHQRVLDLLAMTPVSQGVAIRNVLGGTYAGYLATFLPWQLDKEWWPRHRREVAKAFEGVSFRGGAMAADDLLVHRVARTVPAERSFEVEGALAPPDPAAMLATFDPLDWNALISRRELVPGEPTPLLYLLLRHAAAAAQAWAAFRILDADGQLPRRELRFEPELVSRGRRELDQPLVRVAARAPHAAPPGEQRPISEWIGELARSDASNGPFAPEAIEPLRELRRARDALAGAGDLTGTLLETLDLCSHRLDAWIVGFANERLAEVRRDRGGALAIGAYGWVEDLRAPAQPPAIESVTINGIDTPVVVSTLPGGFVPAPSPAHAATAAILRSGYLAQSADAPDTAPFSIDLSSARVREAMALLEGIRGGVSLGTQLGYRLERELTSAGLARYIDNLRAYAAKERGEPGQALAPAATDGLVVWAGWSAAPEAFLTELGVAAHDRPGIREVLVRIDRMVDGLTDLVTAEVVHQTAQGRPEAAGAMADFASAAESIPAELDVVSSPRDAIALEHRAIALVGPDAASGGWSSTPRGEAEPAVDALAASWLGGAADYVIRMRFLEEDRIVDEVPIRLTELRLAAADVVYEIGGALLGRLRWHAHRLRPALAQARIEPRDEPAPHGELGWLELELVARRVEALLGSARPLAPEHIALEQDQVSIDLEALVTRVPAISEASLRAHAERLRGAASDEALASELLDATGLGVTGVVPDAEDRLRELAAAAAAELDARAERLAAAGSDHAARLRAIFGDALLVVPPLRWTASPALIEALVPPGELGVEPLVLRGWLGSAGRVRDAIGRLERTIGAREIVRGSDPSRFLIAQLPAAPVWIGLAAPPDPRSRTSLLAVVLGRVTSGVAGLVLDRWDEAIPAAEVQTSIAFQTDEPLARAPNAILLGVPPDDRPWTASRLLQIVAESFDLARIRAVDPDALVTTSHVLPAIYLACNHRRDTIETDITLCRPKEQQVEFPTNERDLSITSWLRLEPRCRDGKLSEGLEARIHDPLWLLARQWQFGEFEGEDAASPVRVEVGFASAPIATDPAGTVEAMAEALDRSWHIGAGAAETGRLAIESGRALRAALDAAGLGHYTQRFVELFPLTAPERADDASRAIHRLASRSLPDGEAVDAALGDPLEPPAEIAIEPGDRTAVLEALRAFRTWRRSLFMEPAASPTWRSDRYEHATRARLTLGTATATELVAEEYRGEGISWHMWDAVLPSTATPEQQWASGVAVPIEFPGMPVRRYWELEDAAINLTAMDVASNDIIRMMLVDFAMVYSGDWSMVTLRLPAASIAVIRTVVVTDTFGQRVRVRHPSELERGNWRLFEIETGPDGMRGVIVTAPALPALHEDTVERVELARDELGNIVWGSELSGEDAIGARWRQRRALPPDVPPGISIAPPPPGGVLPFRRIRRDGAVWLARTAIEGAPEPLITGALLRPSLIADEEVPPEGLQLARVYRYARSSDGRLRLWTTNVRRPGRDPEPVGYAFDLLRL